MSLTDLKRIPSQETDILCPYTTCDISDALSSLGINSFIPNVNMRYLVLYNNRSPIPSGIVG
jgi:hypothetical protein